MMDALESYVYVVSVAPYDSEDIARVHFRLELNFSKFSSQHVAVEVAVDLSGSLDAAVASARETLKAALQSAIEDIDHAIKDIDES